MLPAILADEETMMEILLFFLYLLSLWIWLIWLPRRLEALDVENVSLRQRLAVLEQRLETRSPPPAAPEKAAEQDPATAGKLPVAKTEIPVVEKPVAPPAAASMAETVHPAAADVLLTLTLEDVDLSTQPSAPAPAVESVPMPVMPPRTNDSAPPVLPATPEPPRPDASARRPGVRAIPPEWQHPAPAVAPSPAENPAPEGLLSRLFHWFFGGNAVVHLGAAVLFLGFAFLLRYVSTHFTLPIPLRYAGIVGAAFVLLSLGWRLRLKRAAYACILQGSGIATLYLTTLAALHLHHFLQPSLAMILLVALTVSLILLALMQNASSLACVAALGGFAAPILTSSGVDNPLALWIYYAILNAGIVTLAWFRIWRSLNLIGFVATFGIGLEWGLHVYTPALFMRLQPFLILFFLMYVGIGFLFARRRLLEATDVPEAADRATMLAWSARRVDYLDGTLTFAPPLVGFGLQCALVAHFPYGAAWSALVLGLFYLVLAVAMRGHPRITMLREVCLALGLAFVTLALPLAFDARWTSAAWAAEGAALFWLGWRQGRSGTRAFALLLMLASALAFLSGLAPGVSGATLLSGSPLGAALLGAALLFIQQTITRAPEGSLSTTERDLSPFLAVGGLLGFYLIAPLACAREGTIMLWSLMGVATLLADARQRMQSFILCAFGVQFGGVLMLLNTLEAGERVVLAGGADGAILAALVGAALLLSGILALGNANNADSHDHPLAGVALLAGLALLNLSPLYLLDWRGVCAVWAISGLLTLWQGLFWQRISVLGFGLLLQVCTGLIFIQQGVPPEGQTLAPAALALAGLGTAWVLQREAGRGFVASGDFFSPNNLNFLSSLALFWGLGWQLWASVTALERSFWGWDEAMLLLLLTVSGLFWMLIARCARWSALALTALLPLAVSPFILLRDGCGWYAALVVTLSGQATAAQVSVLIGWPLLLGVYLPLLRLLEPLLPAGLSRAARVLGVWLGLAVLALTARDALRLVAEAWYWLALMTPPAFYLWLAGNEGGRFQPLRAFSHKARKVAALPVAAFLFACFWIANLSVNGNAPPFPWLPLANPLEVGLLVVLAVVWRWIGKQQAANLHDFALPGGISLLTLLSMSICRSVHHWGGVPFHFEALVTSTAVQAGWSLLWTCCALVLMTTGTRRGARNLWTAGAGLIGVVVVKLFWVELGESGSLARIVSFMGVGALLLLVGYLAPRPPLRA
ncbi:MAG: DUF2339 domain-containing protein [Zoogloeaceae bacterium]|jgi:uncharacterized membrane protein|nr:DUF2339 domain-containing protein [Zoogloeaceae bacterium]